MQPKFDVQLAVKDHGVCRGQMIKCEDCPIGEFLGTPTKDQYELCNKDHVLILAKLIVACS